MEHASSRLIKIISERQGHPSYDRELFRLLDERSGMLRNSSQEQLLERYRHIVRSIVWLLDQDTDAEPIESGHYSSWWWLRALTQTEAEMERRGLSAGEFLVEPQHPRLIDVCRAERRSHSRVWSRVSTRPWLLDTLTHGVIYFSAAEDFDKDGLNKAQRDDELRRHRVTPGQQVKITGPGGRPITPIGDLRYTKKATTYWFSSWTQGLDLRLIQEFGQGRDGIDSCIVVWLPDALAERIAEKVGRTLPGWHFADLPITYVDAYRMVQEEDLPVSMTKDLSYAIQRELRLGLLPAILPADRSPIRLEIGSIEDIAGLYDAQGRKLAGKGPDTLLGPS